MNSKFIKFFICLIIPQIAAILGSLATTPNIQGWYSGINKPSFNPPNWIFGPVWTILFVLMGISLYLIWAEKTKINKTSAYLFFYLQLVFNVVWSVLFFGLHNPLYAFVEIIFLWIFILLNIIFFYKINKLAGWLLLPYILWVSFAAFLNYNIWILN
ncbi:MAG: TspO/MBR family protein [Patescibacteria group bacterium]|jgi:tryptophan-rich sensory protein